MLVTGNNHGGRLVTERQSELHCVVVFGDVFHVILDSLFVHVAICRITLHTRGLAVYSYLQVKILRLPVGQTLRCPNCLKGWHMWVGTKGVLRLQ